MRLAYAAILLTVIPLVGGEVGFDDHYYYRLNNSTPGDAYSLDSTSSSSGKLLPIMTKSSDSAGQYWKFTLVGGCIRISNVLLGSGYGDFDNYNDGSHPPFMAVSGMPAANAGILLRNTTVTSG